MKETRQPSNICMHYTLYSARKWKYMVLAVCIRGDSEPTHLAIFDSVGECNRLPVVNVHVFCFTQHDFDFDQHKSQTNISKDVVMANSRRWALARIFFLCTHIMSQCNEPWMLLPLEIFHTLKFANRIGFVVILLFRTLEK